MLRDGESGLGVEGEDEPERHPEERFLFSWPRNFSTKSGKEAYHQERRRS